MKTEFIEMQQPLPTWFWPTTGVVVAALVVYVLIRLLLPWRRVTEDALILKEYPLLTGSVGLVLVFFAGYSIVTGAPVGLWLTAGVPGLGMVFFSNIITCTARKSSRKLVLESRSLWKHTTKAIPFEDIGAIYVDKNRDDSGSERTKTTYRVVVVLHSREKIPFRSSYSYKSRHYEKWVTELEEYIQLEGNESPQDRLRRIMGM